MKNETKKYLTVLNLSESDEAFVGSMPNGKYVLEKVGTPDKPNIYTSEDGTTSKWIPVTFKNRSGSYELSLKGVIRARGLEFESRNFGERIEAIEAAVGREFTWTGKQTKEVTLRKDSPKTGKRAGEKISIDEYTFKNQVVG